MVEQLFLWFAELTNLDPETIRLTVTWIGGLLSFPPVAWLLRQAAAKVHAAYLYLTADPPPVPFVAGYICTPLLKALDQGQGWKKVATNAAYIGNGNLRIDTRDGETKIGELLVSGKMSVPERAAVGRAAKAVLDRLESAEIENALLEIQTRPD